MLENISNQKQRIYLDPIHGPIQLSFNNKTEKLLIKLIDTREFQRLRRIHQMGTGWFTFHGAEHTRFGHSLGAFFIARKIVSHLERNFKEIEKYKTQIFASALLHDIGHGPFSHASEKATKKSHEERTKNIITGKTEINLLLKGFDNELPQNVAKILGYKNVPLYVSQIVSSYVDCDRLDYLLRDSYYVGVPYGLCGVDRIISSLEIDKKTKRLVVHENIGLDPVIHYLHARYSMYQQIYQHKKNISTDFLLKKILQRLKLKDSFLELDDVEILSIFQDASKDPHDDILRDLCSRFLRRQLFKSFEFRKDIKKSKIKEAFKKVELIAIKKKFNPDYYVGIEESASKPYEPYRVSNKKAIFIKQKNGEVKELTKVSALVKALSEENVIKTCLIFTPELEGEISKIRGFSVLFK